MTEVVVVGAGIAGLAAANALADRGVDVVCLERAVPGAGQSGGLTRVFRHVHERPEHARLVAPARAAWDAWEERAGRVLTGREGVLFAGADLDERAAGLAAAGIEHRVVDGDELRALLPALAPGVERALHDPGGGATRVRRTLETLAGWLGARLVRADVLGLEPDGDGVAVATSEGIRRCDRVLLCAGAETAGLARTLGLELPVALAAHVRATFRVRDGRRGLPCWLDRSGVFGDRVYSGPVGSTGLFAVGTAAGDGDVPIPAGRAIPTGGKLAADLRRVCAYVTRALPGLDPEPVATRICHVTHLPWSGDAFAVWETGPVSVFAGHNVFKFAPLLGGWLADAALGGTVPPELAPR